jgi:exopolyphosphatase / guanosine-5'-triphosphate,3'-diphosphate pyrophosphatase
MRLAVIDLGTHTMLLLIADVSGHGFTVVRQEQRITGLGRGIEKTGVISPDALRDTLAALQEYAGIIQASSADQVRMTATAVLRDAGNAAIVKTELESAGGFPVTVLSGEEEARLVYLAGTRAFPGIRKATVIDIGGGSVEFVQGEGDKVLRLVSLPLGAVKMTERFIRQFPTPQEELDALSGHLAAEFRTHLAGFEMQGETGLIGVAGTFTTAAAMIQGLKVYDPARITGCVINKEDAVAWLRRVASLSVEEQKKIPGLHPKRAGFIVAGFVLISAFFDLFGTDRITVSDEGLRFGVLLDWIRTGRF